MEYCIFGLSHFMYAEIVGLRGGHVGPLGTRVWEHVGPLKRSSQGGNFVGYTRRADHGAFKG